VHQLGEWLHREQDRGGEGVDLEQQWGVGDGLDMGVALFRDAAAGCLEVAGAARRAMPPRAARPGARRIPG